MSGNVKTTKDGPLPIEDTAMAMAADDMIFLVDCLKNPVGGGMISIDTKAVAEARGYKNAGSVSNRIAKLKKRYNLPITASLSGNKKLESNPAAEAKVPVTPNKSKVIKARTTRGRAIKVPKKLPKSTGAGSDESSGDEQVITDAAAKKAGKNSKTATEESSGEDETKGFKYKGPKSSDAEEGEVSEEEEEDEDTEKPEVLKVVDDDQDEI